jgi:hypothetical protein
VVEQFKPFVDGAKRLDALRLSAITRMGQDGANLLCFCGGRWHAAAPFSWEEIGVGGLGCAGVGARRGEEGWGHRSVTMVNRYHATGSVPPWTSAWPVGIILGLLGLAGLMYQAYVIVKQRKVDFASLDWFDWAVFSIVPMLGNASLIAGAAGLIADKRFALYAIAGAIMLLLFTGIYGAYSVTLWIARYRDKTKSM